MWGIIIFVGGVEVKYGAEFVTMIFIKYSFDPWVADKVIPIVTVPTFEKSVKGGLIEITPGVGDELNLMND